MKLNIYPGEKASEVKTTTAMQTQRIRRIALASILAVLFGTVPAWACEACRKQQPKLFQGITHGAGPSSNWDYVIVVFMVIITIYTLIVTVKRMFKPEEKDNSHIKRMILNQ